MKWHKVVRKLETFRYNTRERFAAFNLRYNPYARLRYYQCLYNDALGDLCEANKENFVLRKRLKNYEASEREVVSEFLASTSIRAPK